MHKIKDIILETKKIEWSKIKDLQPIGLKNDYHSDKTKQSIIENGFSRAIYVWLNPEDQQIYIIDGHLRTDLLNELVNDGYDVPNRLNCTFLDLPDRQTAIKYLLQVFNSKTNPINKQSMDDWLSDINIQIEDINVDIEHLHIEIEIPEIQDIETAGDDDIPESAPPITRRGDIYDLGGVHRVMCGDSTNMEDINKLMDGSKADMVFTDPPYGCDLDQTLLVQSSKKYNAIKNDSGINIEKFLNAVSESFYVSCKEWASGYWFYSTNKVIETRQAISSFFDIKDTIIWKKESLVPGRNDYQQIYEPLFYFQLKGTGKVQRVWNGNRNQVNLWEFNRDKSLGKHPTQKPIDLISHSISNSSNSEAIVLDLFLGSGSTLIACEKTNRKCYGMELDEKYCDIIIKRYIDFCIKNDKPYSIFKNGKVCKEFEAD